MVTFDLLTKWGEEVWNWPREQHLRHDKLVAQIELELEDDMARAGLSADFSIMMNRW